MSKIFILVRLVLGLVLLIFGLNGFFNFMPNPPVPAEAGEFFAALAKTGYFFPFVKAIEVIVGVLLLTDRLTAFALVLFAPILVGIAQINFFLNPTGIPITLGLLGLYVVLVYHYRARYYPMFRSSRR